MVIVNGVKTNISELKLLIYEYKEQLRRMKIVEPDSYPIILNIIGNEDDDEWQFDVDKN